MKLSWIQSCTNIVVVASSSRFRYLCFFLVDSSDGVVLLVFAGGYKFAIFLYVTRKTARSRFFFLFLLLSMSPLCPVVYGTEVPRDPLISVFCEIVFCRIILWLILIIVLLNIQLLDYFKGVYFMFYINHLKILRLE